MGARERPRHRNRRRPYIARVASLLAARLVRALVTLALALTLGFALLQLAPDDGGGDDPRVGGAARAAAARAEGRDRPLAERYGGYVGGVLRGDLGVSRRYGRPVTEVLAGAAGPTVLLAGTALALAFALGLGLGTAAALRPGGVAARVVTGVLPVLDACPPFWLGMLGVLVFSAALGWLPAAHLADAGTGRPGWGEVLRHLLLPALTLALPGAAPVARHHAAALRRALAAPHVVASRAEGLPRARVTARAARVALQPVLALFGLALPGLVGGAAVVEVLFSWPGLGRLQQEALLGRDVPLALGALLVFTLLVVGGGLAADLLAAWADPRARDHDPARPGAA